MANRDELRQRLPIPHARLDAINALLLDPSSRVVDDLLDVVAKYGSPEEINARAAEARRLPNLLARLQAEGSPHLAGVEWLAAQRDAGAFVGEADYRRQVLGDAGRRHRLQG